MSELPKWFPGTPMFDQCDTCNRPRWEHGSGRAMLPYFICRQFRNRNAETNRDNDLVTAPTKGGN